MHRNIACTLKAIPRVFARRKVTGATRLKPLAIASLNRLRGSCRFEVINFAFLLKHSSLVREKIGRGRRNSRVRGKKRQRERDVGFERRKWPRDTSERELEKERTREIGRHREKQHEGPREGERDAAGLSKHPHSLAHPPLKKELILIRFFI